MADLHPAMAGHLEAVTQDAERLRALWVETDRPYVQDYVIWMTLGDDGRIRSWREYWDKARV